MIAEFYVILGIERNKNGHPLAIRSKRMIQRLPVYGSPDDWIAKVRLDIPNELLSPPIIELKAEVGDLTPLAELIEIEEGTEK